MQNTSSKTYLTIIKIQRCGGNLSEVVKLQDDKIKVHIQNLMKGTGIQN